MDREEKPKRAYSRRDFLRKAPLAVVGGLVLGVVSRKLFGRHGKAVRFREGSIFTPAEDRNSRG